MKCILWPCVWHCRLLTNAWEKRTLNRRIYKCNNNRAAESEEETEEETEEDDHSVEEEEVV